MKGPAEAGVQPWKGDIRCDGEEMPAFIALFYHLIEVQGDALATQAPEYKSVTVLRQSMPVTANALQVSSATCDVVPPLS